MSTASIRIDLGELGRRLAAVAEAGSNTAPVMRAIAGIMAKTTEDAFESESDPATGQPWPSLSPGYARQRAEARCAGKTLQRTGSLATSVADSRSHGKDFARVGSNKDYAAAHQFGVTTRPHIIKAVNGKALKIPGIGLRTSVFHPGSKIPARPFLGAGPEDLADMSAAVVRHFLRGFGR